MSDHKTTAAVSSSALLEALRSAGADDLLSYNAVDEVRNMAGSNFSEAFNTFKAEMIGLHNTQTAEINGKFDTKIAEVLGKIETNAAEIRMNRWMLFAFFAVTTAIGLFKS